MRVERWRLRLQPYNFTVSYKPGLSNISDYLSRHPIFFYRKSQISQTVADDYVCFVAELAVPHAMSITEIEKATENDPPMQELITLISCNSWFLLNSPRRHFSLTKVNLI